MAIEKTRKKQQETVEVELNNVGLLYRLVAEHQRTIKGRLLGMRRDPAVSDFWALREVTLRFKKGEVVGVAGSNGAGKSTLLKLIAGSIEPTEGSVRTIGELSPLLELGSLMNGYLTGRENARLFGAANRIPLKEFEEGIERIKDFAELGPFFEVPVKTYSSGMLARLAFAIATEVRPDILLLDEVLSVGDENFQRKSYFRMMKLIEKGSLVIIVSHNAAQLENLCSRVVGLKGGRVVSDGPPGRSLAELRKAG